MAGTLVGVILAGTFVIGTLIKSAIEPFYYKDNTPQKGYQLTVFCLLLICSNIPYLEWAHLEWQDIWKMRG